MGLWRTKCWTSWVCRSRTRFTRDRQNSRKATTCLRPRSTSSIPSAGGTLIQNILQTNHVSLILGSLSRPHNPLRTLVPPGPYRSPELILDKLAGIVSDLWALGCTLFEIRTGRRLFSPFDGKGDDYLEAMVDILGALPEPWWSSTWKDRRNLYKDEPDKQGRAVLAVELSAPTEHSEDKSYTSRVHPSVPIDPRSLLDTLAPGVWYMSAGSRRDNRHWEIS